MSSTLEVVLAGHQCIVVAAVLFTWLNALLCPAERTVGTVSIMCSETFAQKFAGLPSFSFIFNTLNKEQLIEELQ